MPWPCFAGSPRHQKKTEEGTCQQTYPEKKARHGANTSVTGMQRKKGRREPKSRTHEQLHATCKHTNVQTKSGERNPRSHINCTPGPTTQTNAATRASQPIHVVNDSHLALHTRRTHAQHIIGTREPRIHGHCTTGCLLHIHIHNTQATNEIHGGKNTLHVYQPTKLKM